MRRSLQVLLTLGLLAFIMGVVLTFVGKPLYFTSQGYWRGAIGCWMLLIATRMTYRDKN